MKLYKLLKYAILLVFIFSMYPWFMWSIDPLYMNFLITGLILLCFLSYSRTVFGFNKSRLPMFFLLIFFIWVSKSLNIFGWASNAMQYFSIVMILSLDDHYKDDIISMITKGMALLLGISIVPYIIYVAGLPLPHSDLTFGDSNYILENYYFFITNPYNPFRFRGPFLEPGHLTLGLAPLLFINKYNVKNRYVLVLLIAQILTFSLAGYIVMIFGYLWQSFTSREKGINRFSTTFLIITLFVVVGSVVGSETIENNILERLEFDSTTGTIAGNNRTSDYFDSVYDNLMNTPAKWTGIPFDFGSLEQGVAGYKRYVVEYGLIGVLLVILFYTGLLHKNSNKHNIGFIIMILLLLYQDAYPLWWCILLSAILGTQSNNEVEKYTI